MSSALSYGKEGGFSAHNGTNFKGMCCLQKKAASEDSDGELLDDTDDEDFSGYVPKVHPPPRKTPLMT